MAFKKNTAVTGFTFGLVSKTDGSDVTTGTPVGHVTLDGGVQAAIADVTPVHEGNGQWSFDLTAAEMNGSIIGLTFTHISAITAHFTIKTEVTTTSDLNNFNPATTPIATVTNLTNLPSIPANWITAAGIATSALNGKGNWNIGKTGYTLTQTFPTNFADMAITLTTGKVTVGTNSDKAGYSISGTKTTLDTLNDIAATSIVSAGAITTSLGKVSNVALVDTTTANTDMRGTNGANTVVPDNASIASILTDTSTTLNTKLNNIQGATFSSVTDSLEAIRNRGDAAWTTGAGGTPPQLLQSTTIATLASQTSFTLTAGSADDNAYNGAVVVVTDSITSTQKAVGDILSYTGATKTITLSSNPGIFIMAAGDIIDIIANASSAPSASVVASAVWNEALTGHITAGTYGKSVADIEVDTNTTIPAQITALNDFNPATTPIATVTTLTNLPSIPANWITAAGIATSALNGKGNWNIGKTGYTLTQTFPTNFADMAITLTTGKVTVGTNSDKTGYTLSSLPSIPTNWITAAGVAASALNGKGNWNIGKAGYSISGIKTTLDTLNDIATTSIVSAGAITTSLGKVSNVALVDTTTTNTDMRGTDGANTTAPDNTSIASILTDTGTTIPAQVTALNDFNPATNTVNIGKISGSVNAATRLSLSADQIIPFTVSTSILIPTVTDFQAGDITEATTDHYNGRVIIWTTGALAGQATSITAYSLAIGQGKFTVVGMTEAPVNGDTGVIV